MARGRSTGSRHAGMTPRNGPTASRRRWKRALWRADASSSAQFGATGICTGGLYSAHLGYIPPMTFDATVRPSVDFDFDGGVGTLDLEHVRFCVTGSAIPNESAECAHSDLD